MIYFLYRIFFGTNIDKSDDKDKEAFVKNESGSILNTTINEATTNVNMSNNAITIGSCSTPSNGFSFLPHLPSGFNIDIGIFIGLQQNLSIPSLLERPPINKIFMHPFMLGSHVDAGESSTLFLLEIVI